MHKVIILSIVAGCYVGFGFTLLLTVRSSFKGVAI